jgi:hypothetical protein
VKLIDEREIAAGNAGKRLPVTARSAALSMAALPELRAILAPDTAPFRLTVKVTVARPAPPARRDARPNADAMRERTEAE